MPFFKQFSSSSLNEAEKGELSSAKAKVGEKNITEKATYSLNETETFDLPKTVGRIQYDTLFINYPEISVDYSVYHNKIEEDIYINSPTDLTSFTMDVQIGDLCGIVNKDGSVEFKNEAGKVIYRIGVPYMHDSADSVLNDITVTLDQTGDTCTVTYTPNSEYVQARADKTRSLSRKNHLPPLPSGSAHSKSPSF